MVGPTASRWRELGAGVYAGRYRFFDQEIGLVVGDGAALVVDTRTTPGQAAELLDDVRRITPFPVDIVIDTHAHSDHCFGNAAFAGARIWSQRGAVRFLAETGERQRRSLIEQLPELAEDLAAVTIRPPEILVDVAATLEVGGRRVDLAHLGRAHTDHDLVVRVADVAVTFAGDIVEEGAPPYFGDGYPLDWPDVLARLMAMAPGDIIVPGHGDVVDAAHVRRQADAIARLCELARQRHAGQIGESEAVEAAPFPVATTREAFERASAQLAGELD
jgi:glyoxylase-like metal-dependent hydrolase (beta-lactamase superfamily II)